jgi:hypothetical protein
MGLEDRVASTWFIGKSHKIVAGNFTEWVHVGDLNVDGCIRKWILE